MNTIALKSIVWQEGEHFVAQCLNVDVNSFGSTKDEAIVNLQEALELFFEDAEPHQMQHIDNPEIIETSIRA
jgi:predicted RNase H-like HicB family nuclease